MHIMLQTWLAFTIQVCINGREWLARQMDRAGITCSKRDNCFTYISDLQRAQQLMDRLTTVASILVPAEEAAQLKALQDEAAKLQVEFDQKMQPL